MIYLFNKIKSSNLSFISENLPFMIVKKNILTSTEKANVQFIKTLDKIIAPDVDNIVHRKMAIHIKARKIKKSGRRIKKSNNPVRLHYSPIDVIEAIKAGISFQNFKKIYNILGFTNKKWAEIIGVSEKTIQTLLKEKKALDRRKTEKLLDFLLFVEYGLTVFGDIESFKDWLHYKTPLLNNKAPFDYLDSLQGIAMLREIIYKIETGNLA